MRYHWKDLEVWQLSHQMVLDIYKMISSFSPEEKYSLCDQIKRAAISIPNNIVEGHSKNSKKDFIRYLYISRGSLEELRYLLFLSSDLKFIPENEYLEYEKRLTTISVKLNNLIHSLKS
ncbi:MAG: four helix bundle protein [Candidatus Marinimicrobia bacterium]|nr:four helix bundle protein [Candidatus Neomarinimicrobiota bacterium]